MHKRLIEVNVAPLMQSRNRREALAFAPAQGPEGVGRRPLAEA
jgi:hypothetical protein